MKYFLLIYIIFIVITRTSLVALNGKGTWDDPYQIINLDELQHVIMQTRDIYYILMNDIDASETKYWNIGDHDNNADTPDEPMGFMPIYYFYGSFDGNGHIIQNLYINRPNGMWDVGLFGLIAGGGEIKKLGIENCDITGSKYVGSICGEIQSSSISECYTTGQVMTNDTNTFHFIGGFCGDIYNSKVENCYSSCTVTSNSIKSSVTSFGYFWGVISTNRIERCYSTGKVISLSKATVFGEDENAKYSFWDVETTGILDTGGHLAKGLSTSEMKKRAIYDAVGWAFDSRWCIDEGKDYPKLRAFGKCKPVDVPEVPIEKEKTSLQLNVFPNPSNESITILAKIIGYDKDLPINIKFYAINGKFIKSFKINNGVESVIDINEFQSGSYLISAESIFINDKGIQSKVSDTDLIVIQK